MDTLTLELPDEPATLHFAAKIFTHLMPGSLVFLRGGLGVGKTIFVRGCLRAAGYMGVVKSPTFTLVEEYRLPGLTLFHFDLYRLNDPEELEWLGIRDYLQPDAICLIEWPERAAGSLPEADLDIELSYRKLGRAALLRAKSPAGLVLLQAAGGP